LVAYALIVGGLGTAYCDGGAYVFRKTGPIYRK